MTKRCDKDTESPMPPYISRREDGRSPNFYVRLVAPTAVQPFLPKSEHVFRKSTGTADRRKAVVVGTEIIAAKRREWFALLQSAPVENSTVHKILTPQLVQQIAGARLHSWVETDRLERYGEEGLAVASMEKLLPICLPHVCSDRRCGWRFESASVHTCIRNVDMTFIFSGRGSESGWLVRDAAQCALTLLMAGARYRRIARRLAG